MPYTPPDSVEAVSENTPAQSPGGDAAAPEKVAPDAAAAQAAVEAAAEPAAEPAAVEVTPGWEAVGTCEWMIDDAKCLHIRPAKNAAEGKLPDDPTIQDILGIPARWPWSCSDIVAAEITGKVIAGDSLKRMFYRCHYLEKVSLAGLDTSNTTDFSWMFGWTLSLKELDVSNFNTGKATSMRGMFAVSDVESLDLSGFDTSHVTTMDRMFGACRNLEELDLSGFDVSSVQSMYGMFCEGSEGFPTIDTEEDELGRPWSMGLKKLNLSGWDTSNVTNMAYMFAWASEFTSLDLSGFNTSNVTTMNTMFVGMSSLTYLDISGFDTRNVSDESELPTFTGTPLQLVSIGENFTAQSNLPGDKWFNREGVSFAPADIPQGVAGVYARAMDVFDAESGDTSIELNITSKTVTVGDKPFTISATVSPFTAEDKTVVWTSSNPSVATVDNRGRVTVLRANPNAETGTARIFAACGLASAYCDVEVNPLVLGGAPGSAVEGKMEVYDADLARKLAGYSLLVKESEAKKSTSFERELLDHVSFDKRDAAVLAEVYDIDMVNAAGEVFDWTGSSSSVFVMLKMSDALIDLAKTRNLSVWWADLDEKKFKEYETEIREEYLYFMTEHLSTYAVVATERANDGDNSDAVQTSNNTATKDDVKKDDTKKDSGIVTSIAQTGDDLLAVSTLLVALAGTSAFLLFLSAQSAWRRRKGE